MCIVIYGKIGDRQEAFGPFHDEDAAIVWATSQWAEDSFVVLPLRTTDSI